jgi:hypothetical protein
MAFLVNASAFSSQIPTVKLVWSISLVLIETTRVSQGIIILQDTPLDKRNYLKKSRLLIKDLLENSDFHWRATLLH